ncbi:ArnT family glycosyltransferase [Aquirufa rosea]|uniref:Glycosyltransferase family 39 protein n=1 Tax=Aquirufa rosea TaxID=2509241 RepID=A0A4Q1C0V4_9BACT|nr:glycosyltransferase family 39 protein [Aquirufa rosea]RXK50759.1 glycosyltransferase family 39 protein [Aquirufa rosea]
MMSFLLRKPYLFWFILGALVYVPFLGASHLFDWDEINFAESAREMIQSGDYLSVQINFKPFWEKPPLFIWFQALSFLFFGIFTENAWVSMEFAARFPNALIGISTLLTLYQIGAKHFSPKMGHLWAFSYLAAITPHVYASSGIIDPLFNLLIFLGVYYSIQSFWKNFASKELLISAVLIGLALLTKGPVALLIWGLTALVYVLLNRQEWLRWQAWFRALAYVSIIAIVFFVSWYGIIAWKFGTGIIADFFAYQVRLLTTGDAGHGQPFYYHALVLLFGCFPVSIWAISPLISRKSELNLATLEEKDLSVWFRILFWVVLILFSLVKTKIVHYSSLCWIPISFFSARVLYDWDLGLSTWKRVYSVGLLIVGFILSFVLSLVPYIGSHTDMFIPLIKDKFVQGNLQVPVYWSGYEVFIGIGFAVAIVYWMLAKGALTPKRIYGLMGTGIVFIMLYMAVVVPKIEGYTQATVIDFYESKVGQKVYIETVGFKSFAHLLYFQKPSKSPDGETLLKKKTVDRPTFFIMKNDVDDAMRYHPHITFMKEENGFLFFKHK